MTPTLVHIFIAYENEYLVRYHFFLWDHSRLRMGQCNLKARFHPIARHPTDMCNCGVTETGQHTVQRSVLFRALGNLRDMSRRLSITRTLRQHFRCFVISTCKYLYLQTNNSLSILFLFYMYVCVFCLCLFLLSHLVRYAIFIRGQLST